MATEDTPTCQGCGRPNPVPARVHEGCRQRAAELLADIPGLAQDLPTALISGGGTRGDGVKRRKPDAAPLGLNLAAFNLLAAGAVDFDLRETSSQIGVLPLHVWLGAWYDDWAPRYGLGPVRAHIEPPRKAQPGNPVLMRSLLTGSKVVVGRYYGAGDGYTTAKPISDTLDAEYAARFGRPDNSAINLTVAGLASRLDAACDDHEDIGSFLLGLRIMVAACRSVVGEQSDLTYLGRCPEQRNTDDGDVDYCGGAIWQDAYMTQIVCPRCKTEWPVKAWLRLATQIRRVWPVEQETHRFVGSPVVIKADAKAVPPVVADRYWLTACACGAMEVEKVRGNKIDARGAWRRHHDEVTRAALGEAS
jgi:hypothetical protein